MKAYRVGLITLSAVLALGNAHAADSDDATKVEEIVVTAKRPAAPEAESVPAMEPVEPTSDFSETELDVTAPEIAAPNPEEFAAIEPPRLELGPRIELASAEDADELEPTL